ncbi:sugar nucleotide-binding protein [Rhodobacterales bacterium HKCCA1058]|nr:sugar nucleotide-binding protein [Rhodobacterales bacterium HKCCA1058]
MTITPIPTRDHPTHSTCPLKSRLECHRTQITFGIARQRWRDYVAEVIKSA